jgi:uracil-DNA glycosylase
MIKLHASWLAVLENEFEKPYMKALKSFLIREKSENKSIYPPSEQIFAAFDHAHFNDVKVVILGQDPYHGPNQAHGLCFSVNKGVDIPPSLRNIYKEQANDVGTTLPSHGSLMQWADQGVLLLNATLTVRAAEAGSHQKKGWEIFTDEVIRQLSDKRENLVFLLWGAYARSKSVLIDRQKHLVLEAPHPSPLSAHTGFLGCGHFSAANRYLVEKGLKSIDWQIT